MLGVDSSHGPDAQHPLPFCIHLPSCHRQTGCGTPPARGGCRVELQAPVCQAQEVVVQRLEEILGASHLVYCSLTTNGRRIKSVVHWQCA